MPPPTYTMLDRPAAQLVIERLMLEQSQVRPRSTLARIVGLSPLGPDSIPWYVGALGEIAVARILASLPPEWTAFHALPIGSGASDIDHLVIGPGGIFTISTKHHSGRQIWVGKHTVMVSGQTKPYIDNALREADQVAKLLATLVPGLPPVQPLVVVVDPQRITIKQQPARVRVVNANALRQWLLTSHPVLATPELATLRVAIDDPAMWRAESSRETDAKAEFDRLDHEVRASRLRRMAWSWAVVAAACVAGYAALLNSLPPLVG
jgi:hypothetical protein